MAKQKRLFDGILVVDLEATCWEKQPPEGQFNDIIEIGICCIDILTKQVYPPRSQYVIPTTSQLSDFCIGLTKITQEQLDLYGRPFPQVCHSVMENYKSRNRAWVSWGNYDRTQTQRQCLRENVPFPFGDTHWNMKDLYTIKNGLSTGIGLQAALNKEKMEFIGQPHSGRDDAYNVARLFTKLVLGWNI